MRRSRARQVTAEAANDGKQRRRAEAARNWPSMSGWIENRGCRIRLERRGRGAVVLFIQGVGVAASGWKPEIERLSDRYDCLTFDNRGIGRSRESLPSHGEPITIAQMADDARAVQESSGAGAAHIVGHSLGGMVAMNEQPRALRAADLTPHLARLAAVPTLVVSAPHDRIAPTALGRAIVAAIPNASYAEMQGASHGLPITHPEPTCALLREHFAAVDAPPS